MPCVETRYGWGNFWIHKQILAYGSPPLVVGVLCFIFFHYVLHGAPQIGDVNLRTGAIITGIFVIICLQMFIAPLLQRKIFASALQNEINSVDLQPDSRVLVVGCSRDRGYWFLKTAASCHQEVFFQGVDVDWQNFVATGEIIPPNNQQIEWFEQNKRFEGVSERVSFDFGDGKNLADINDDTFDVVIHLSWSESFVWPHGGPFAISEVMRVLKPQGQLIAFYIRNEKYEQYLKMTGVSDYVTTRHGYGSPAFVTTTCTKPDHRKLKDLTKDELLMKMSRLPDNSFGGMVTIGNRSKSSYLPLRIAALLLFIGCAIGYIAIIYHYFDALSVPTNIPEDNRLNLMFAGTVTYYSIALAQMWRSMTMATLPESKPMFHTVLFIALKVIFATFVTSTVFSIVQWLPSYGIDVWLSGKVSTGTLTTINVLLSLLVYWICFRIARILKDKRDQQQKEQLMAETNNNEQVGLLSKS